MLLVYSLFAAALLGASDVTTSSIQQALPQGTPGSVCERGNGATEQGSRDAHAFIGVISEVDYSKGLVTVSPTLERRAGTAQGVTVVYESLAVWFRRGGIPMRDSKTPRVFPF